VTLVSRDNSSPFGDAAGCFLRGDLLRPERRGEADAVAEPQKGGGEDGRDLAQSLVGSQAARIELGSHGRLRWGTAHSDLRVAAGRLFGGKGSDTPTDRLLQLEFEMTHRVR
jgi:hypothetical protein